MGIFFESDEEKLARRIKNIENMDKPIKFHQWFIPFTIFFLLPIGATIGIIIYKQPSMQELIKLGEMILVITAATTLGVYLYLRFIPRSCFN